jgi:hypothetical protein
MAAPNSSIFVNAAADLDVLSKKNDRPLDFREYGLLAFF